MANCFRFKTINLIIIVFTILLVSCGTESNNLNQGTSNADESSVITTLEILNDKDDLGDFDFEGIPFRVLNAPSVSWNTIFYVEEMTGDLIIDSVFMRNKTVEDRFNFIIEENTLNDQGQVKTTARNEVLAGTDSFDMAILVDRDALSLAQEGFIYSMNDLTYIDTTKNYWSQTLNRDISISGELYFSYGDYNLTGYDYTIVMLFNKQLTENYNLENFYTLISDNKWTYDKFAECSIAVTDDLNGDGQMNDEDRFGFVCMDKHVLPSFWIAGGVKSVDKDENDNPYFSVPGNEKFAEVYEKIFNITKDIGIFSSNTALFSQGKSLFTMSNFKGVGSLRDMTDDFGIIPFPKYDESQSEYYSRVGGGSFNIVPITAENVDMISVVLEGLASESRKSLIPDYYEVALKTKYIRDENSIEMLDLIFNSRIYDLGDTYWCTQLRDGVFAGMFTNNDRNLISKMESIKVTMDTVIGDAIEAFEALK